jgi:hypothetical protein
MCKVFPEMLCMIFLRYNWRNRGREKTNTKLPTINRADPSGLVAWIWYEIVETHAIMTEMQRLTVMHA